LVIGHWSLVIGHWSLVIGHWSLVIGHWSLVIGHLSFVIVIVIVNVIDHHRYHHLFIIYIIRCLEVIFVYI